MLVRKFFRDPELLSKMIEDKETMERQKEAVMELVQVFKLQKSPILNAQSISRLASQMCQQKIGRKQAALIMKEDLRMSYRQCKRITPNAFKTTNLKKKCLFAVEFLKLLDSGKRIVNIDESAI
jgi:transposase